MGLLDRFRKPSPAVITWPRGVFGAHVLVAKEGTIKENAAAWWATPDDPRFLSSPTFRSMDRAVRTLDGIHTIVFSSWFHELTGHGEPGQRFGLPKNGFQIDTEGPGGVPVSFFASLEKGIRFQFHESTPRAYREEFWSAFADHCEGFASEAKKQKMPMDPPEQRAPSQWWAAAVKMLEQQEREGIRTEAFAVRARSP